MIPIPFTSEQFFNVFRQYNEAVWPSQFVLYAVALLAVVLAARTERWARRGAIVALASLWLWSGIVYHLLFFRAINPAATLFGIVFVAQAGLLVWTGVARADLRMRWRPDARGLLGATLIGYALIGYPLIGWLLGQRFPASPTFGLPCPTTIFTLGILAWARRPMPRRLLVIPVLWAVVATQVAVSFEIWEDLGLTLAAVVASIGLFHRRPTFAHAPA